MDCKNVLIWILSAFYKGLTGLYKSQSPLLTLRAAELQSKPTKDTQEEWTSNQRLINLSQPPPPSLGPQQGNLSYINKMYLSTLACKKYLILFLLKLNKNHFY